MVGFFHAPDGRRLRYADSGGDGPPVLCLAGLSRNMRDFGDLADHLAPRFRVVRLDSRGRGGSEPAVDPHAEYTVPVEAGDAMALLDHLDLRDAALIGTSRGGILSMAIAAAQPDRIHRIVLNDVGAVVELKGLLRILKHLGAAPEASDFAAAAGRLKALNTDDFPGVSDAEWLLHARRLYDADPEGRPVLAYDPALTTTVAAALADASANISLWSLFEPLAATPMLVIRGENSDILTAETLAAMVGRHPGLATLTVRNRGHAPFLNEPKAVAAIDDFLAPMRTT